MVKEFQRISENFYEIGTRLSLLWLEELFRGVDLEFSNDR